MLIDLSIPLKYVFLEIIIDNGKIYFLGNLSENHKILADIVEKEKVCGVWSVEITRLP